MWKRTWTKKCLYCCSYSLQDIVLGHTHVVWLRIPLIIRWLVSPVSIQRVLSSCRKMPSFVLIRLMPNLSMSFIPMQKLHSVWAWAQANHPDMLISLPMVDNISQAALRCKIAPLPTPSSSSLHSEFPCSEAWSMVKAKVNLPIWWGEARSRFVFQRRMNRQHVPMVSLCEWRKEGFHAHL